jgi:hypothetical protein
MPVSSTQRGPDRVGRAVFGRAARRAVPLLCMALVSALLAVGCGDTDRDLAGTLAAKRDRALQTLSPEDVAQQPAGSPQRAIVELWRSLQYRDPRAALALVAPRPPRRLRLAVEDFIAASGAQATANARPKILSTRRSGNRAIVWLEVIRNEALGAQGLRRVRHRALAELVKSRSGWRVRVNAGSVFKVVFGTGKP